MFSNIEEIGKRADLGGFGGLRYGKNVEKFMPPPEMLHKPVFSRSVYKTMHKGDLEIFQQEDVERGEFLQAKHGLAGKKEATQYEDGTQGLAFDPLADSLYVGDNSYDNGVNQGGVKGAAGYVSSDAVTRSGRGDSLTLGNQDPYAHRLSNKIKIHQ